MHTDGLSVPTPRGVQPDIAAAPQRMAGASTTRRALGTIILRLIVLLSAISFFLVYKKQKLMLFTFSVISIPVSTGSKYTQLRAGSVGDAVAMSIMKFNQCYMSSIACG